MYFHYNIHHTNIKETDFLYELTLPIFYHNPIEKIYTKNKISFIALAWNYTKNYKCQYLYLNHLFTKCVVWNFQYCIRINSQYLVNFQIIWRIQNEMILWISKTTKYKLMRLQNIQLLDFTLVLIIMLNRISNKLV